MIRKEPRVIEFYVGSKCNLRCEYCDIDKSLDIVNGVEKLRPIIEKYSNSVDIVIISGGEPTLYKNEVMSIVKEFRNMKFNIVTNGTNLNDILDIFNVDTNRVLITVSWDGHINDRGFDSYDTIKHLYSIDALDSISMVISNGNYKYIEKTINTIKNEFPRILLHEKLIVDLARISDDKYDIDLNILKDQLNKLIRIYPSCKLFSSKNDLCQDLFEFKTECFSMHNGILYEKGCIERIENDVYVEYTKMCQSCKNTECRARMCPMTVDIVGVNPINMHNLSYCKIHDIIHQVKEEYNNEVYWNDKKDKLINVELILTTGCNLRCKYCFQPHNIHNNYKVMTNSIVDKVFDEFIYKNKNVRELMLFGGEPILPQTLSVRQHILEKIKSTDLSLIIVTNGYNLSEDEINWYKLAKQQCKNISVQFSIDTIKNINDKYRVNVSGKGVFDVVLENLKTVSKIVGVNNVGINSVATTDNLPYLADWGSFITSNILHKYCNNFSLRFDQSRPYKMSKSEISIVKDSFNKVIDYYEKGRIDPSIIRAFFNMVKSDEFDRDYLIPGCEMCSKGVTIDPSGRVIPCHLFMSDNELDMKDYIIRDMNTGLFTENFKDIVNICGGKYIMKGIDKYCGDCECQWECVKCKGAQLKNGSISTPLQFTCKINTVRHEIEKERLGERFKPFTDKERVEFINDIKSLESEIHFENDPTVQEEFIKILHDVRQVAKERMW